MFQFSQTKIKSVQIKNKLAEDIVTTNICMRTSNSKYTVSCYTSFFNKQEEREFKVTQFCFEDTNKKSLSFSCERYKWEWSYSQKHKYKPSSSKIQILDS